MTCPVRPLPAAPMAAVADPHARRPGLGGEP